LQVDEGAVECTIKLLETVAPVMLEDENGNKRVNDNNKENLTASQRLDTYANFLQMLRPQCSTRMKFAIDELLVMRSNKWKEAKKAAGPMKIKEVLEQKEREKLEANIASMSAARRPLPQHPAVPQRGSYGQQQSAGTVGSNMGRPPMGGGSGAQTVRAQPVAPALTERDRAANTSIVTNKTLSSAFDGKGPTGRRPIGYGGRDSSGSSKPPAVDMMGARDHSAGPSASTVRTPLNIRTTDQTEAIRATAQIVNARRTSSQQSAASSVIPSQSSPQLTKLGSAGVESTTSSGGGETPSSRSNTPMMPSLGVKVHSASEDDDLNKSSTTIGGYGDSSADLGECMLKITFDVIFAVSLPGPGGSKMSAESVGKGWLQEVGYNWRVGADADESANERRVAESLADIAALAVSDSVRIDERVHFACRALMAVCTQDQPKHARALGRLLARLCQQGQEAAVVGG
jgi:hypothetical protein